MRYITSGITLTMLTDKCTGCGMCMEVCPHEVFKAEGKRVVIAAKDRCMECGACELNCAFGALNVSKGVGCASALIKSMITGGEPTCGCSGTSGNCC
ncbi:MAG: mercury methylation ferredoxin HgcB [Nitrospiraceae bacterium]|nr:mercury methylation ferredoxin HgcB [Nitrospiraceae bacterium]